MIELVAAVITHGFAQQAAANAHEGASKEVLLCPHSSP